MLNKNRSRFIILLVIVLIGSFITNIYANSNKLKNKQSEIKGQIKNTKGEIEEKKKESKNISDEIAELDRKISEIGKEIAKTEEEILELEKDINLTEEELNRAEEELEEKKDIFNQRIRVMYMNGNVGYLEMLLSSDDIKDFLSRKDILQSIAKYDKELVVFIKEQKELIENKKEELEIQKLSLEDSKNELEKSKAELELVSDEKNQIMKELEKDLNALEKEYDKLNKEAKDIESEILKLQSVNTTYVGGSTGGSVAGGRMSWPVPSSGRISSYFGYRTHPVLKRSKLHTGIDIPAGTGQTVVAAESGRVIKSGWFSSYGQTVMIDHGGGIVTLYAHNSSLLVSNGQTVQKGAPIARVGSTGMSTGPHCHFEVRQNGRYIDPLPWVR